MKAMVAKFDGNNISRGQGIAAYSTLGTVLRYALLEPTVEKVSLARERMVNPGPELGHPYQFRNCFVFLWIFERLCAEGAGSGCSVEGGYIAERGRPRIVLLHVQVNVYVRPYVL